MTKLPWILWKNVLERGLMKKLVADMDQDGSKTAKRILQVKVNVDERLEKYHHRWR